MPADSYAAWNNIQDEAMSKSTEPLPQLFLLRIEGVAIMAIVANDEGEAMDVARMWLDPDDLDKRTVTVIDRSLAKVGCLVMMEEDER